MVSFNILAAVRWIDSLHNHVSPLIVFIIMTLHPSPTGQEEESLVKVAKGGELECLVNV